MRRGPEDGVCGVLEPPCEDFGSQIRWGIRETSKLIYRCVKLGLEEARGKGKETREEGSTVFQSRDGGTDGAAAVE